MIDINNPDDAPTDAPEGRALDGIGQARMLAAAQRLMDEMPSVMPLRALRTAPIFNSRAYLDERAIEQMARTLANGDALPPLTVMGTASDALVVDGHFRLAAYALHARRSQQTAPSVPVVFYSGTPTDAVFASIAGNCRNGVALTTSERTDAAWKLILIGEKSRSEITAATGVSRSRLTTMRKVKRDLGEEATEFVSWLRARLTADGRCMPDLDEEDFADRKRAKAEKLADQITRAIGGQHANDPELVAMIMENYMGRRTGDLLRELRQTAGSTAIEEEDEF